MKLYVKPGRKYYFQGKDHGPGEAVDVPDKFARALTHPKGPLEMRAASNPTDLPPIASAPDADDLAAARREYEETLGRRPYHGWDVAELRSRANSYRTTNMGDSANTTHLTSQR